MSVPQVNQRVLCITLLLGLSNDDDKNVKVRFCFVHLLCLFFFASIEAPGHVHCLLPPFLNIVSFFRFVSEQDDLVN